MDMHGKSAALRWHGEAKCGAKSVEMQRHCLDALGEGKEQRGKDGQRHGHAMAAKIGMAKAW